MANPSFRSYGRSSYPYSPFYHPSSPSTRGVPITSQPMPAPFQKPSVISIPVQFINANQPKPEPKKTPSESAAKIQKVWRGFCVRRSLKKVQEIRRQVDEVERKISDETTAKMIRTDEKERLKVNETLMSLLFRLDSVRSSEDAVRDLRKAAIRRAIALQEKVDSMAVSDANHVENTDEIEDEGDGGDDDDNVEDGMVDSGAKEEEEEGKVMQQENNLGAEDADVTARDVGVDGGCEEIPGEQVDNRGESFATLGGIVYQCDHDEIPTPRDPEPMEESKSDEDREKAALVPVGQEILETTKVEGFRSSVSCISGGSFERDEEKNLDQEEHEENSLDQEHEQGGEKSEQEDVRREEADVSVVAKRPRNGEWIGVNSEKNRELLERMAEDNERMMTLMAELFERNEAQTRILSSLSQRVEQLENAFLRDKLRRNKKKKKKKATKLVKAKYGAYDRLV